jgi:hypothetical protein
MSISFSMRASVAPEVMIRKIGRESVILDLKSEIYSGLDEIGTRMWEVLTASGTIEAAYNTLLAEYQAGPEQIRKDLEDFIGRLVAERLLVVSEVDVAIGTHAI